MKISLIVAFDENNLIGNNNALPWHLPADLKHFKNITFGHHMIMGRKTYDSIGKPLPGRVSIIITRQVNFSIEGCLVVNTLEEALNKCIGEKEVFVIGGAQIFECTLPLATHLYITQIHHAFTGDTHFPEIATKDWQEISSEYHPADEKNKWPYSFINYIRKVT
ncbi:MAG: dihydrofolate reductase [Bacteroidetes bacterium]|nr:dihydrofolate reductase [Bacteroidota bacterium]